MGMVSVEIKPDTPLSDEEKAELIALSEIRNEDIDYSDLPAQDAETWRRAPRKASNRPHEKDGRIFVEADIFEWLLRSGEATLLANRILRERMLKELEEAKEEHKSAA